jgi:hypothetical protein
MTHREYDQASIVEAICERLAEGKSLASICRDKGMPTVRTFLRWCNADDNVASAYSEALQARAEWYSERHELIAKTAVDRETAAAARVQLAALEWQLSRMAPRRYGERLDVAVDASIDLGAIIDRGRQRVLEAHRADDPALPPPDEEPSQ